MIESSQGLPERRLPSASKQSVQESDVVVSPSPDAQTLLLPMPYEADGTPARPQTSSLPPTERRRVPRTAKAQIFVTLCHWAMVTLLALSLLSGMRIGWGYVESPVGGMAGRFGGLLGSIAPKGTMLGVNLITLHVMLAFFMLLVVGVYVGYLFRSHTTRRWQVTRPDLQKLWTGLRTGNFWRNKPALWSANLLTYWVAFLFIAVLILSGVALYRLDWGLSSAFGGYTLTRALHALVAYLLIPFTVIHMLLEWFFGRFWSIFKAHLARPHIWAGLLSLAITLPVVVVVYLGNNVPTTLTVKRITSNAHAPVLDGDASDPIWHQAEAVTIRTVKGVNNPHDYVDVLVKAVHDGEQIYFLFQWDDPEASYKRYPLVKTEHGWKVLQTAFEVADENVYYEDKLSMYITDVTNGGCAATCHLGVGPSSDRGEKHGLHYTEGEIGDVWHWKSVRTNPMGNLAGEPGYIDDQHFRVPDPIPTDLKKRYTGGYYPDPAPGGGYAYNFTKLAPDKPLAETYVRPKMLLPMDTLFSNPDPTTSEHEATWWIQKAQGLLYTEAADTYPVGTLMPNILIEPFQGDAADIRAKGAWHQGRWTLEARRVLDTKSQFDVPFIPGKPVYISVATFNRSQTRHSEHIAPVRAVLQP